MTKIVQNRFYLLFLKLRGLAKGFRLVRQFMIAGTVIFLGVLVTACGGEAASSPAARPEQPVRLTTPFTLPVGQSASLEDAPLKITFEKVLEDIRCPSQVNCAENGFARIQVVAQLADEALAAYEMNTEPFYKADMGLGVNKISHSGYDIELTGLNPHPQYPDDELNFEAYEATLVVSKTAGR